MRWRLLPSLLAVSAGWGQTLSFEVASIKPADPPQEDRMRSNRALADRINYEYATLRYCIAFAYGVADYQITGPAWLADDRWQIQAKAPEGSRRDQLPLMMQTLLAGRFKLKIHEETRDFDGLAMAVAKNGPKLKRADAPGDYRTGMQFGGGGRIEAKGMSMSRLASLLTTILGRPVADQTGLDGEYAFTLEYAAYEARGGMSIRIIGPPPPMAESEPGVSIFSSIQTLGLKLESRKVPLDVIVVDHIEKTPTQN